MLDHNGDFCFGASNMNKIPRIACVIICALIAAGITTAQPSGTKPAKERTIFYEDEESFPDSLPLPEKVLNALKATKEAGYARDVSRERPHEDLNQFFKAVQVHLSNSEDVDYIVLGQFPLTGADCAWFWLVRSARTRPKVVLFSNTNSIELLGSRTNGYRDIRSVWQSPNERITRVYHYNGEYYTLVHKYDKLLGLEP
jgi:hypothetical protein